MRKRNRQKIKTIDFCPKIDADIARNFYSENGKLENWRNFKRGRKPFVRNYLLCKQNNICPVCGKTLDEDTATLHHVDYMFLCLHSEKILHGEMCEICKTEHCHSFLQCTNKMIMVHTGCHFQIHKREIIKKKQLKK